MSRIIKVRCNKPRFRNVILKIKLDLNGKYLERKWIYFIPTSRNETGKFSNYTSLNFPLDWNNDVYFLNDIIMSFYFTSCDQSLIEVSNGTQQEVHQILTETRFPTNIHFMYCTSIDRCPGSIQAHIRYDFQSYHDLFSICDILNLDKSKLCLNKFNSFNLITSLVNYGKNIYKRSNKFYSFKFNV